jgi:hypothetical protein
MAMLATDEPALTSWRRAPVAMQAMVAQPGWVAHELRASRAVAADAPLYTLTAIRMRLATSAAREATIRNLARVNTALKEWWALLMAARRLHCVLIKCCMSRKCTSIGFGIRWPRGTRL